MAPDHASPQRGGAPPDPSGIEEPHDVLAAEEFAVPTREPGAVPSDPTGIQEPHDVLAAEEFAMPAGGAGPPGAGAAGGSGHGLAVLTALLVGLIVAVLLRRRR